MKSETKPLVNCSQVSFGVPQVLRIPHDPVVSFLPLSPRSSCVTCASAVAGPWWAAELQRSLLGVSEISK